MSDGDGAPDRGRVEASLAGPKRPQDRVPLKGAKAGFQASLGSMMSDKKAKAGAASAGTLTTGGAVAVAECPPEIAEGLDHGAVVVAAITSCTHTSNPSVMIGAW